jgi:hypothetical protein
MGVRCVQVSVLMSGSRQGEVGGQIMIQCWVVEGVGHAYTCIVRTDIYIYTLTIIYGWMDGRTDEPPQPIMKIPRARSFVAGLGNFSIIASTVPVGDYRYGYIGRPFPCRYPWVSSQRNVKTSLFSLVPVLRSPTPSYYESVSLSHCTTCGQEPPKETTT